MAKSVAKKKEANKEERKRSQEESKHPENGSEKRPLQDVDLDNETLIRMYREMLLIRRFEEKAAQMYGMEKIMGFCHLYNGQEAVAVGANTAMRKTDYMVTAYRDHGHALVRGITPNEVMAELFGKVTGCSRGKGGSMHLFDAEKRMMGGHAIVGGHIPLAAGFAFGAKYKGEEDVSVCFFGEAAANQGVFHETLNMAALWKLPVVYICENNRYGMGTAFERAFAVWDIYERASAYDMPRAVVDGMDVLDMYLKTKEAVDRARNEHIPTLLEARTYRFRGHSMSDPIHGHYRTKEEVEEMKVKDPILNFGKRLNEEDILSEDDMKKMDDEIKQIVNESIEFAEKSEEPPLEDLYTDVYVD
jgi:pyruvate dehydrogenase E1 component alpha subunit